MAHDKNCQNCGKSFTGNINRQFCSDACRKYYKRHGNVSLAGVSTFPIADKTGQSRTLPRTGGSSVGNYAAKKSIDVLAKLVENSLIVPKSTVNNLPTAFSKGPLQVCSSDLLVNDPLTDLLLEQVELTEAWKAFLGNISYPFKMLVWGLPGSGKSTFCMQLASEIASRYQLLYVSGEEALKSQTLLDKQRRVIKGDRAKNCVFMDRLPSDAVEWKGVLHPTGSSLFTPCKAVFYDSITRMGITPFYVNAAANDYKLPVFTEYLSHVFITHAHKDGKQYRGDGSWGHEVDVIVRVEKGVATTEKNRFGGEGNSIKVY